MKAEEICKSRGFTLAEVAMVIGQPKQALIDWHSKKPKLFDDVLTWFEARKKRQASMTSYREKLACIDDMATE